ncbi:trypsin-like peptidase domain-containing protein [Arthrobacter sp. zg-Y859]|uniref:Trypsin-like peptidase domain-containing protein n=2 Tax=Arthrobacter jinronghuae TaxID=2964609 RepID=A0ABT1NQV6_9MICC|nr:trypsin-like peptidase domain-containing protein [Arthrobacter jinronghuae]MCQ1948804.1 trypsin-like peptidase domain-containing protein [Arthrobacter jinronghuae]UWX78386.1 trypsin-like peptidase domain-containing protein [Arthrobacter jinronghuae]
MVVITFTDGSQQSGSGFLVTGRKVLTAEHCTRDISTKQRQVREVRVLRASDGAAASVTGATTSRELDVAVLELSDEAPWDSEFPKVLFARARREHSGMLEDCEAIGYPLFQRDPDKRTRDTGEVHGTIYLTDEAESGRFLMREPRISPGAMSGGEVGSTGELELGRSPSPWGGYSGALLFYSGRAIGVVVEHHPRQGDSALRAISFDRIAEDAETNREAHAVSEALGLPDRNKMVGVSTESGQPLAGLVELLDGDDLPLMSNLTPYRMGATATRYSSLDNSQGQDPYVPRTFQDLDTRLQAALTPGEMVLIVGPSKAGKTRSAYEALRERWPQAHLAAPERTALTALVRHPRLRMSTDPVIVWLDDLQDYLNVTAPLTPALLAELFTRPGPTLVVATLRTEERILLAGPEGELTRNVRQLMREAVELELGPTNQDAVEQSAAHALYPEEDLSHFGLAEQLAGAPALLQQYRDARDGQPLFHAVIQSAVDWTRAGMPGPVPETELADLATQMLLRDRPDIRVTRKNICKQIERAGTPPKGAGRVAALQTVWMRHETQGMRGYHPFSYLVAADDDQMSGARAIPTDFWRGVLGRADDEAAFEVGFSAYQRDAIDIAVQAWKLSANAGETNAMNNLGVLLSERLDPPDLDGARHWYTQAANAGQTSAMNNLGVLLSHLLDPPELDGARHWYT